MKYMKMFEAFRQELNEAKSIEKLMGVSDAKSAVNLLSAATVGEYLSLSDTDKIKLLTNLVKVKTKGTIDKVEMKMEGTDIAPNSKISGGLVHAYEGNGGDGYDYSKLIYIPTTKDQIIKILSEHKVQMDKELVDFMPMSGLPVVVKYEGSRPQEKKAKKLTTIKTIGMALIPASSRDFTETVDRMYDSNFTSSDESGIWTDADGYIKSAETNRANMKNADVSDN